MALEELGKEIYKKDARLPEQEPDIFRPERERRAMPYPQKEWQPEKPREPFVFLTSRVKKYLFWSGFGLAILGLIFFIIWGGWAFRSFDKSRVELSIEAPQQIESGEKLSVKLNYANNNKITLRNVKLTIEYPADSLPLGEGFSEPTYSFIKTVEIGEMAPQEKGKLEFPVIVFGTLGEKKEFIARLAYLPSNFASHFENKYSKTLVIEKIPFSLDWHFVEEAVSGQKFEAKLSFVNASPNDFYNIRINVEYPSSFAFESSEPAPSEGQNTWDFKRVTSLSEEDIIIRGRMSGVPRESKSFRARLGILREKNGIKEFILYDELQTSVKIVASPLFVSQKVLNVDDNTVSAGSVLNYTINYKNTTNVGIERVEVRVGIMSEILDWTTLKITRGSFDSFEKMISWKGGEAPELNILAPSEEGELFFSIRVKDPLPIEKFSDKNFTISSRVVIDSANIPSSLFGTDIKGEHLLVLKVNSRVNLKQKGFYFESPISNSGPIPPQVGQTTTYNIIWQITNSSNDVENVKVEGYLPAYVSWRGQVEPKGADIFYDPQTRRITWNIGKLPAHTGILSSVKQVIFQVGLVPSLSHLGKIIDLIGEAQLSGKDAFTGKILQDFSPVIMTDLPNDPFVRPEQGIVAQ